MDAVSELAEGDYDTVHFADTEFDDVQAGSACFVECAFTSVTFARGRLRRARTELLDENRRRRAVRLGSSAA